MPCCLVWDLLTLDSAPLQCTSCPPPLQGPLGTVSPSPTPKLGAVSTWMHMHTGWGQSRGEKRGGDGLQRMKGLLGRCTDPALNVLGCEQVLWHGCNTAMAVQVWTQRCPSLPSSSSLPFPHHRLSTLGPGSIFLCECSEIKLFSRERNRAHFISSPPTPDAQGTEGGEGAGGHGQCCWRNQPNSLVQSSDFAFT